jgi:proteasome lid subunit RPN8/RPN11
MEPGEQLKAMLAIEEAGEELLAIYHSHPGGPAWPSPSDVAEAAYPGVIHLIWYRQAGDWECGGFLIEGDRVVPAVIHRRTAPAES